MLCFFVEFIAIQDSQVCWQLHFIRVSTTKILYHPDLRTVLLPPANKVCEGYVFTPVCQSFCSQGGITRAGTPPWVGTPRAGTPSPGNACWDTVNKWAVRILLECILVLFMNRNYLNLGRKTDTYTVTLTYRKTGRQTDTLIDRQRHRPVAYPEFCQIFPKTARNWKNLYPEGRVTPPTQIRQRRQKERKPGRDKARKTGSQTDRGKAKHTYKQKERF